MQSMNTIHTKTIEAERVITLLNDYFQAINDAIHSGRTHEDALKIGPTGDYE